MFVVSPISSLVETVQAGELDPGLIQACQRGERQALGCFVRCYQRRIFAYLSRNLGLRFPIEDLAQEVFVRALPALARFDLRGPAKLSTWLLCIAHHVALDARRRDRGNTEALQPELYPSSLASPADLAERAQLRVAVARAVEQLTPEQREVFVLAEFHELTMAEISSVVGVGESTVKTRLFRAKAKLQLALGTLFTVET
jgi:RNA polymerase sigma-70 factor (ECF subfamily)